MSIQTSIRKPLVAAVLGALVAAVPLSTLLARQSPVRDVTPVSSLATSPAAPVAADAMPAAVAAPLPRTGVQLPDFSALVERYGPAVVNIQVKSTAKTAGGLQLPPGMSQDDPFFRFFQGDPRQQRDTPTRGEGSGFIVDANGIVLTNAHVVQDAKEVTVKLTDKREFVAKVLGSDRKSDVAVLKIDAKGLPTVRLGDPSKVKVGEWVVAIGAPFGFENSVTQGIVSAKGRVLPDGSYVPFLQTDVAINPGNSGGPLFNLDGEVIGINSQIYSRSGGYQGVSFSIPMDVAMNVADQLRDNGHVSRARLGVTIQSLDQGLAKSFGLDTAKGALVASVEKDSPADQAGIEAGDIILSVGGQPIADSSELPVKIASRQPGSKVDVEVWRKSRKQSLSVKLGEMDAPRTAATQRDQAAESGRLGLAVRPLTGDEQRELETQGGLLVQQVGGAAAEAGIQPGDVVLSANGQPITSVDDLKSIVAKSQNHIALLMQRGDTRLFVPVELG
jgi:serine protease Do